MDLVSCGCLSVKSRLAGRSTGYKANGIDTAVIGLSVENEHVGGKVDFFRPLRIQTLAVHGI